MEATEIISFFLHDKIATKKWKRYTACLNLCPFYDLYGFCKLWECRIIIQRHHEQTLGVEENKEVS